jgi:pSer/pThr/pTyr-binding forkhead associated (FHA) protein
VIAEDNRNRTEIMPRLVLLSEGFAGRTYELKTETTTVGRVSDNTFEIPEASVYSHHAEIVLKGNDVLVRDLNSTNGTFINGERITEAILKPGQILRFGTIELKIDTGEPLPKPGSSAAGSSASGAASRPASAPRSKPSLDQTVVIPQGVKLEDLQGGRHPPELGNTTGFDRKTDRGNKIFILLVVTIGIALIAVLVWVAMTQFR